ncbi:MAG: hypothetical protein QHH75_12310 [Bacillota bacterium]|nr:hypothetical protein [Bacillota bacterium]
MYEDIVIESKVIANWRLKLDKNTKNRLVSSLLERDEKLLAVSEVYLTDVALAVHFTAKLATQKLHESISEIKKAIAGILRLLSGYAEQQGVIVPVIGVISPVEGMDEENLENEVAMWAADQDWHRGDFSLFYAPSGDETKVIYSLLSGATALWTESDKIKQLESKVYLKMLKNTYRFEKSTDEHRELMNTIIQSWETGNPIKDAILEWTAESLSEIDKITGEK